MAIYIQLIKSTWTKKSRGNPGAALRNRVPETLLIRGTSRREGTLLEQVSYREHTQFLQPRTLGPKNINEQQLRELNLALEEEKGRLSVGFWKTQSSSNKRYNKVHKSGELTQNQWCQLKSNHRRSLEDTWAYDKLVYNIYFGELTRAQELMQSCDMQFCQDHQISLW